MNTLMFMLFVSLGLMCTLKASLNRQINNSIKLKSPFCMDEYCPDDSFCVQTYSSIFRLYLGKEYIQLIY
jgi:hypothetical protein